ncbi:hypothetical protein [Nonomuraea sp. NPDC001023]|uniref:hypothetical protein n=1 Tax=unclassified Nonomuraea TaxID=2593643 RepID=UPI00332C05CC
MGALHVLRAVDIDPAQVQRDLDRQPSGAEGGAGGERGEGGAGGDSVVHFSDAAAGQVLGALGAESRLVRRAVTAALAGYVHLRAQTSAAGDPAQALAEAVRQQLQPLIERIERLEQNLGSTSGPR